MAYLEIDKNDGEKIDVLKKHLEADANNKLFLLYFMDGCGACQETYPEWKKLKEALKNEKNNINTKDIMVASLNQVLADRFTIGKSPSAFPTIRFITHKGKTIDHYEDPPYTKDGHTPAWTPDRGIDSFVDWIQYKSKHSANTPTKSGGGTRRRRRSKSRKWSRKYKRSINCKRPRGFSQKQYCTYGRKRRS